jgi:ParB-like nuclease domain
MDDYLPEEPPRPVHVQIADIVLRPEWQVRTEMNDRVVGDYVTATIHGTMPPILLGRVNGALMLVDGWHRLAAAKRLRRETITAVVENMTENAAKWAAADANTTHGLPLRFREKREVFRRYMQTKQHRDGRRFKSYRDIAGELHGIAGKSTLQRWMADDFPSVAAKMATERPAKTEAPATDEPSNYFRTAVEHLEQIVAAAPALCEDERRRLADHLKGAMSKVIRFRCVSRGLLALVSLIHT